MFEAFRTLAKESVMERVVLLVNHVIRAEPVAMARLEPHASQTLAITFVGWPALLPTLPLIEFHVSPAGLVEWQREPVAAAPDLQISVDAGNPALLVARLALGERPAMQVEGDAAFASDVNWLVDNLRWDIEDDLARIVGVAPARELARFAATAAAALRRTSRGFGAMASRHARRDERARADDRRRPPSEATGQSGQGSFVREPAGSGSPGGGSSSGSNSGSSSDSNGSTTAEPPSR